MAWHRPGKIQQKEVHCTCRIFRRPHYQSDATQFINQLKATKPELDKQQQAGRALLWDKQVDRQLWNDYRQARVAQKPYVYQTNAD